MFLTPATNLYQKQVWFILWLDEGYTDQQGVSQTIHLPTNSNPTTVTEQRLQKTALFTLHYLRNGENLQKK
jgi:hypothetical protein